MEQQIILFTGVMSDAMTQWVEKDTRFKNEPIKVGIINKGARYRRGKYIWVPNREK